MGYGHLITTDTPHTTRGTSAIFVGRESLLGDLELALTIGEIVGQHFRHRDLIFGVLGQRHTDRIAHTVSQQRTDTYGALYTSLDTVARLRYAQMNRVGHRLLAHCRHQQSVGIDHHARIARLHRNDHLIEPFGSADAQKLHCRHDHTLGRIAPLVKNTLGKRAVIDANAQSNTSRAALLDQSLQTAIRRAVITRIDTHLIDRLGSDLRHLRDEVNIGHNGGRKALRAQLSHDISQILALARTLCREADNRSTRAIDTLDLRHACGGIVGVGVGHRLHGNGCAIAYLDIADTHAITHATSISTK